MTDEPDNKAVPGSGPIPAIELEARQTFDPSKVRAWPKDVRRWNALQFTDHFFRGVGNLGEPTDMGTFLENAKWVEEFLKHGINTAPVYLGAVSGDDTESFVDEQAARSKAKAH